MEKSGSSLEADGTGLKTKISVSAASCTWASEGVEDKTQERMVGSLAYACEKWFA